MRYLLLLTIGLLIGCAATVAEPTATPEPPPTAEPTLPPTATPEPDLNTNLAAHWPFAGDATDASGNGNDGVVDGATLIADRFGRANHAYQFDGIDDAIEVPHSQSIGLTFKGSISAWVYFVPQEVDTWYSIIEKTDPERDGHSRYGLWIIRDRAEWCVQPTSGLSHYCLDSAESLVENEWNHIVGTWDSQTIRLYLNGDLSIEETYFTPDGISSTPNSLFFGTDPHNGTVYFLKGAIDDVRIYRRPLEAAEVTELYNLEE